jgi:hypothetical protein
VGRFKAMGLFVPISLFVRLVALFFVLGVLLGLWVGIDGWWGVVDDDRPMAPAVTTTTTHDNRAAP